MKRTTIQKTLSAKKLKVGVLPGRICVWEMLCGTEESAGWGAARDAVVHIQYNTYQFK